MGRRYHLSKKIAEEQAGIILQKIIGFPDVKKAQFDDEMAYLDIETTGREYSDVMSLAVNLFSRLGNGCELSFSRFLNETAGNQ